MIVDNSCLNSGNNRESLTDKIGISFTVPTNDSEKDKKYAELIPGKLYLGDFSHAFDPNILKSGAFTHVLNVSGWGGICCQQRWEKVFGKSSDMPVWKIVKLRDLPNVDISAHFEECFEFLDNVINTVNSNGKDDTNSGKVLLANSSKVLLHCQAGISRSSTIAIAYLMKRNGWSIDQAYQFVSDARPIIKPNKGFMQQLLQFHLTLHSGKSEGSEQCKRRLLLNYLCDEQNKDST